MLNSNVNMAYGGETLTEQEKATCERCIDRAFLGISKTWQREVSIYGDGYYQTSKRTEAYL